jgi:flagellar biosynthetic protein FlhB
MAENEDGQEKTEQPTPKRLEESRKKGQVPRSRELNTMAVTLTGALALMAMSSHFVEGLREVMQSNFSLKREDIFEPMAMIHHLGDAIWDALWILAPFFIALMVVALLASVALGGFSFSAEALAPKLNKLNPIKGMGRVFSLKGLVELVKALAKFLLIAGVTALLLWLSAEELVSLSGMEVGQAIGEAGSLIGGSLIILASTLILIALLDVPFQLWDHNRQLRMTKQEIRDEMKDTEGRPEVKGRIRSLQRELAQRRMMEEVPKADVVVTNPTRFAVALRYDQDGMVAPKVVAKGVELVAANIREIARENSVPVVESPMLARALYFHTEIGDYIPAGLYLAVAKLLAYIFQLRVYFNEGGERPPMPEDLTVPEEFRHD